MKQAREAQLRLAAVVGEIEGLYTAWLRARGPARRRRLLLELATAGTKLATESARATTPEPYQLPRTRRTRRTLAAQRGADWLTDRFDDAEQ
ncbi:hypothetical protein [Streptacidiphilus pinicola]|uniref:hypothetical protein n=1 Tax=Streptacidiphilus pinicola TaxID=2219663 RepID=UPI001FB4E3E0|nr:hypothetical protein [Streptacidiphilus pinicola]